jgi:hypothetical protein
MTILEGDGQKPPQIPFGNDKQESKGNAGILAGPE